MINHAELDLVPAWKPDAVTAPSDIAPHSAHGKLWCIFECADPYDLSQPTMKVEMNVDVDGKLHAHQNHPESDHRGPLIAAERVAGIAHVACYKRWYEQTYRTPFTMSA